jgi:hypothetical protein
VQKIDAPSKKKGSELDLELYSQKFCFEHIEGDMLYPIRIRDRKSGRLKFQVWDKDKSEAFGVEEDKMVDLVLKSNYAVRMRCPATGRNGGYRRNGYSVRAVRRLTK